MFYILAIKHKQLFEIMV